jgi:hypothetical protein
LRRRQHGNTDGRALFEKISSTPCRWLPFHEILLGIQFFYHLMTHGSVRAHPPPLL